MRRSGPFKSAVTALTIGVLMQPVIATSQDIDIFIEPTTGTSGAPNIIFLVDNSPNWSRAAQHWPDNGGNQGQAELASISSLLDTITASKPANIGLAMLSEYAGSSANGATPGNGGGYIRFGIRDMTVAANKTALKNILTGIYNNITSPSEKLSGMPKKEESAALYEIYKYFSGLTTYTGPYAQNPNADVSANPNTYTAAKQGLTSGFAVNANNTYASPIGINSSCANLYIIYVANNANNTGSLGQAAYESNVATAGAMVPNSLNSWTPAWTRFLNSHGALVPNGGGTTTPIVTFVLDAYNAQQNTDYSNSLNIAAKAGGGKYYQVGSQAAIANALNQIMAEIQSINSNFASASLPVNATNRAQNENQVFIGMFRPDSSAYPRWQGNMKRYQLVNSAGTIELGDINGLLAVNPLTGFITPCATSFWTTDTGTYWQSVPNTPNGTCPPASTPYSPYSDSPDGPIIEKGAVAEVLRKGNNPPATNTAPTWVVNRTVYTLSGSNLVNFTTASSGLAQPIVDYTLGKDVNDENNNANLTEPRPSIHGDVIHSRPLPVNYGGATGITVYYGANDGTLRAVDAGTGKERWAFIAPEFFPLLQRLANNSPQIQFPNQPAGISPTPTPKDYFFDGSIGLYQPLDNSRIWIYPVMRRGGRMIYAFDVTNPASPVFKWKAGCPNLTNDTGCTSAGMSGIGQTWSMPNVALIKGYSTTSPVIVVGGGYDACEDADSASPSCGSTKGNVIYVLNANDGSVIRSFSTTRAVASDVSLVDLDNDGMPDFAYAADTGGNIYRIDFTNGANNFAALGSANWSIHRVAYTNGAGRKFLFAPALLEASGGNVYVAIGSGDREHPLIGNYAYSGVTNRFYVYLDNVAQTTTTNLDDTGSMTNATTNPTCDSPGTLPNSPYKGWFMNLNQYGQGEQTVGSALIAGGMVTFSTNRPVPPAANSCSANLGEARGYWVNLFNGSGAMGVSGACGGGRSAIYVGGGLPPSPVLGVVPIGGVPTTIILGAPQRDGAPSSPISPQQVKPPIDPKRTPVFWKSSGDN